MSLEAMRQTETSAIMLPREAKVWFQVYLGDLSSFIPFPGFDIPVATTLLRVTRAEVVSRENNRCIYKLSSLEREESLKGHDKRLTAYLDRELARDFIRSRRVLLREIDPKRVKEVHLIVDFPLPEGTMRG